MTASKTRTTRKLLGSLGVVAGMGTFGTFTDSTTPLNASVSSGTLSLDLSAKNAALSLTATDMVPGDSISRAFDLVNSGKTPFGGIEMTSTATTSSILDTDKVNGLKLTVKSCSVAWASPPRSRPPCCRSATASTPGTPARTSTSR
jgi:hypothetical protein